MVPAIDERDFEILTAIAEQATLNTDVLSDVTGIPRSTVRYRLRGLKEGSIQMKCDRGSYTETPLRTQSGISSSAKEITGSIENSCEK